MIVKYRHITEPNTDKTYDTKLALRNNPFIQMTQEEFDAMELQSFELDKMDGIILKYEVIDNG
jgi:hypothetical protein